MSYRQQEQNHESQQRRQGQRCWWLAALLGLPFLFLLSGEPIADTWEEELELVAATAHSLAGASNGSAPPDPGLDTAQQTVAVPPSVITWLIALLATPQDHRRQARQVQARHPYTCYLKRYTELLI